MKPLIQIEKPTIQIETVAKAKMFAMANYCTDKECAAKGIVERINDTTYRIIDFVLYPQLVTGVTVTDDEEAYVKWLIKQENADKFKCHMHSHVNMGVSPSGVDWNTWESLIKNTPSSKENPGYLITIIVNQKQDYSIHLYDKEKGIIFEASELDVVETIDGIPLRAWYTEQEKLYIKKKPVTSYALTTTKDKKGKDKNKDKKKKQISIFDDYPYEDIDSRRDCPKCGGYTIPYSNGWRECMECGHTFNSRGEYK